MIFNCATSREHKPQDTTACLPAYLFLLQQSCCRKVEIHIVENFRTMGLLANSFVYLAAIRRLVWSKAFVR
jgi:hypothetical protein